MSWQVKIWIHSYMKLPYRAGWVDTNEVSEVWILLSPLDAAPCEAQRSRKQKAWSERSQVLITACSKAKQTLRALQMKRTKWMMGTDSTATYSKTRITISLTACQSTYHLSPRPSVCLPIHLSAEGGMFFFSTPSHHRCIEIQSPVWTRRVWGELPE